MPAPIIYPQTNLKATEQLNIVSAKGVYVYDESGKEYLEGMSGLWSASLGYGNEELIQAASDQLHKLSFAPLFGGKTHAPAMQLAEALADIVPIPNAKFFFGNSGSDANDTILKILRYYNHVQGRPEKKKIISRHRGYHGVTMSSTCLTGLPALHQNFDLPINELGILHTDCPHYYRDQLPGETEEQFCQRLIDNIQAMIEREGAHTIAAFIAEPINGAGGVVVPPIGYFEKLQPLLAANDIMLIADEVITGFGRTGRPFGSDTFNIKPQLMTLAKAMSASYLPISASVVSDDIYQALVEPSNKVGVFGHGYTYSGHPVCAAVALKTLEIYKRDNLFGYAHDAGEFFQQQLAQLINLDVVGEVRGKGLIAALEIVSDKEKRTPAPDIAGKIANACLQHGLLVRQIYGNSIALCPPLVITYAQIHELVDKLKAAINDVINAG